MNPLRLQLKNFCSVAEMELDLSALTLAGISGKNGSSKSTIFTIAPLFALYGKPRPGTSIDDLVRTGTRDMLVQYEFEHQGSIYQITRTRSLKGKGKSTCELCGKPRQGGNPYLAHYQGHRCQNRSVLSLDVQSFLVSLVLQGDVTASSRFAQRTQKHSSQILALDIYAP